MHENVLVRSSDGVAFWLFAKRGLPKGAKEKFKKLSADEIRERLFRREPRRRR